MFCFQAIYYSCCRIWLQNAHSHCYQAFHCEETPCFIYSSRYGSFWGVCLSRPPPQEWRLSEVYLYHCSSGVTAGHPALAQLLLLVKKSCLDGRCRSTSSVWFLEFCSDSGCYCDSLPLSAALFCGRLCLLLCGVLGTLWTLSNRPSVNKYFSAYQVLVWGIKGKRTSAVSCTWEPVLCSRSHSCGHRVVEL